MDPWCWTHKLKELSMKIIFHTIKHDGREDYDLRKYVYIHGSRLICKVEGHINQHHNCEILN